VKFARGNVRRFLADLAQLCVVVGAFVAFLLITPYFYNPAARDQTRAAHAKTLKNALELYHRAHGSYPLFSDNSVDDLKDVLVSPGYLKSIPTDPRKEETGFQYRYVSDGQNVYGLLFRLEATRDAYKTGGACVTGANTAGTGMWGQPPDCPF
jgi:hypothetical protein